MKTQDVLTRQDLFDMMHAYKTTSLLRTGINLGIFDGLADGPVGADTLAGRLGTDPRGTRLLLNALAAIKLVQPVDDGFQLAPGAEALLVTKSPDYFGHMAKIVSSDWEWDTLKNLSDAVRSGGTVLDVHAETPGYPYWEDFATYATFATNPTAELMADVLVKWAKDRPTLDILDVACGHGLYGFSVAARDERTRLWDLDWPNVLPVANEHARRLGLQDRVQNIPCDMFTVPLGGPYDVVMITNVLHHFSEERATELLSRLHGAVKPDGRIAIVGFTVSDKPPAEDPAPHLFSILMLAWTHQGEVHATSTYDRMLTASGFTNAHVYSTVGLPLRILIADRVGGPRLD